MNVCWCYYVIKCSLVCGVILLFYFLTHNRILQMVTHIGFIVVFIYRFLLAHLLYYHNELRFWFPKKFMQVLLYLYIVSLIYPVMNSNSGHFICLWKLTVSHSQRKNFDHDSWSMSKCFRNTKTLNPFKGYRTIVVYWFDYSSVVRKLNLTCAGVLGILLVERRKISIHVL